MTAPDAPLPSEGPLPDEEEEEGDEAPEDEEEDEEDDEEEPPAPAPRPRPPAPTFKFSTFLYVFLGLLGIWMLFDLQARNSIACLLGTYVTPGVIHPTCATGWGPLYAAIGFSSSHLFLTMALAAAVEMLITSVAYNYTTDWVKAAKVQKWSSAFRKVQMEAIRSGKKDRIEALKPYQEKLARLSAEVSIAQFKGMAITYFLLILIYTWVGIVIATASTTQQTLALDGAWIMLTQKVLIVPFWFLIFSLYTVPFSLVFRRALKQVWLRRYVERHPAPPAPLTGAAGGTV